MATVAPYRGTNVKGTVTLEQADTNSATIIMYDFTGIQLPPSISVFGIHIHEVGSTDCLDAKGHCMTSHDPFSVHETYLTLADNPYNLSHGLLDDPIRHAGDLGNIPVDSSGNAKGSLSARLVTLSGPYTVINRTFVVHGTTDDGGKVPNNENSSITGNSGARVACGIINLYVYNFCSFESYS